MVYNQSSSGPKGSLFPHPINNNYNNFLKKSSILPAAEQWFWEEDDGEEGKRMIQFDGGDGGNGGRKWKWSRKWWKD